MINIQKYNMRYNLIFIMSLILFSCNDRNQIDMLITQAEEIVSENPDSSILILQKIIEPERLTDSLKAKYGLAIGQAHYNSRKSMQGDSLILYAFDYYNSLQPQNTSRLIQSHKLLANFFWWNEKKEDARSILNKGINLAEKHSDRIGCITLLKSIININMIDGLTEGGIDYVKKLIDLDYEADDLYKYYNELGIMYYYSQNKDSALFYLEKSMEYARPVDSIFVYDYLSRNYADILSDFGLHKKAIAVQKEVLNNYVHTKNKYESLSYISLSRYYLNLGMKDSAFHYMRLAEETHLPFIDDDLSLSNYYTIQKTILDYVQTGEFNIRLITYFSNNMFESFLDRERVIQGKNESQRLLERRNSSLLLSKQRNQFLLVIIMLVVLISAFIISVYIQKRKKLLDEKEEELEALKKLIADSKVSNNKDANFFKRILLQQLGIIKLVATNPTHQNQEFLHQMQKITNKDIPVDDLLNWDDLYGVIDMIYDNFYSKIHEKYSDALLNKEYQLFCLLKADFSTKEISVVTQQSIRTIYQRKSTIRQKLNMNEKEDIIEFLNRQI